MKTIVTDVCSVSLSVMRDHSVQPLRNDFGLLFHFQYLTVMQCMFLPSQLRLSICLSNVSVLAIRKTCLSICRFIRPKKLDACFGKYDPESSGRFFVSRYSVS